MQTVNIQGIKIGRGNPLTLIAGPCVIESKDLVMRVAEEIKNIKNGIWLCRICHKMIDDNLGIDFPSPILKLWQKQHSQWLRDNINRSIVLARENNLIPYFQWIQYIKKSMNTEIMNLREAAKYI